MLKFSTICIYLALGLLPSLASAALIVMDNGDRLTAEILGEDEESLRVEVSYLGELRLPKSKVMNLAELLAPASEVDPSDLVATAGSEDAPVQVSVVIVGEEAPAAVDVEGSEDAIMAGYAQFFKTLMPFHDWDKRLQMGMTAQSGRKDKVDLNYRLDMQRKGEVNQYNFKAEYAYGKTGDVQTSGKLATDFRWRQDIAPGVFYQSNTTYASDEIKKINSNIEQKLGVGTRFLENETMTLSSGLGASGRWRDLAGEDSQEVAYLVDLFQDWDYKINDRLRLRQDLRFAVPLEDQNDYEYNFTAALVSDISKAMNLSLRYEVGYDNSLDDEIRSDHRFVSSLGYKF